MIDKSILPKLRNKKLPSLKLFWLCVVLTILFLMGGSSRDDVQSLAIMYPLVIISCGLSLFFINSKLVYEHKLISIIFAFIFILTLCYLVPLPEQVVSNLPGMEKVVANRDLSQVRDSSFSVSLAPLEAWNSVLFLFVPLSVFLIAVQLNREDLLLTLPITIFAVTASAAMGLLQLAGEADSSLYLYRITNNGNAVGLFANRNHAAVFLACLFPMLAVFTATSQAKNHDTWKAQQLLAIAIAILSIPLILVTGSRSGMLSAAIGLVGGALVYNSHALAGRRSEKRRYFAYISLISVVASLVFVTIYFSRAEAIDRLFREPANEFGRVEIWTSSIRLFLQYFPTGYGPGSFVSAFLYEEPLTYLHGAYLNRLHNDWLETILTFGIIGIALLLFVTAYYIRRTYVLWFRMDGKRTAVAMGRMASVIFAILGIASMSDYPLRTPAMMGFSVLVFVWFIQANAYAAPKSERIG